MVFYVEGMGPECKAESLRCAPDANGRLVSFRVYVRKLGKVEGETKGNWEGTGGKRREREEEKVRVEGTEGEGKRRGGRKGWKREREGEWNGEWEVGGRGKKGKGQ